MKKIRDFLTNLSIRYLTGRFIHYAILATLALAAGFAVGWPRYQRLIKDKRKWKYASLRWRIRALPRMVFNGCMCLIVALLDIVADKIDAVLIFQKPRELFNYVFLTQRTQAALDIWAKAPHYWNDKQKFFFKRVVKIANSIDHDKDEDGEFHFRIPKLVSESW